jgi:hypothetical protein
MDIRKINAEVIRERSELLNGVRGIGREMNENRRICRVGDAFSQLIRDGSLHAGMTYDEIYKEVYGNIGVIIAWFIGAELLEWAIEMYFRKIFRPADESWGSGS